MDRTPPEPDHVAVPNHVAVVDAWLKRSIGERSSVEAAGLLRAVFESLWSRAVTTLGTVTLIAIAERVLHTATTRYPFFSAVNTRPNGDTQWKQHLQDRLGAVPKLELIEGARFALIELLTVIGRLTAEILSQELHAAVLAVAAGEPDAGTSTIRDASPGTVAKKAQS